MDFSGWQAVIPIAIACVGLYTIASWAYRGLVWVGVKARSRTRASRVDQLAARMDGLEHRMDSLENCYLEADVVSWS